MQASSNKHQLYNYYFYIFYNCETIKKMNQVMTTVSIVRLLRRRWYEISNKQSSPTAPSSHIICVSIVEKNRRYVYLSFENTLLDHGLSKNYGCLIDVFCLVSSQCLCIYNKLLQYFLVCSYGDSNGQRD